MRRFLAFLMVVIFCFCASLPIAAAEVSSEVPDTLLADGEILVLHNSDITVTAIPVSMVDSKTLSARSTTYESVWLNSSSQGNFKINTALSGTIGVTLKVESSSNDSWAFITFKSPSGKNYLPNGLTLDPTINDGDGYYFHITGASAGKYTVEYIAYTSVGMRIMCWMY